MSERDQPPPPTPTSADPEAWRAYWATLGMPWRHEPAIDPARQRFLAERRAIQPDFPQGIYPFKDLALTRADVEWLLTTHEAEGKRGPVDASDLQAMSWMVWETYIRDRRGHRIGLDLRGADLGGADLSGLPLARLRASLAPTERDSLNDPRARQEALARARVRLTGANLRGTHLEQAVLLGAALDDADLEGAYLGEALFDQASFQRANLRGADLSIARGQQVNLQEAHLAGADLTGANFYGLEGAGAHLEGATLKRATLSGARLRAAHLERADLSDAALYDATLDEAQLEAAILDGASLNRASFDGASLAHASLRSAKVTRPGPSQPGPTFRDAHLPGGVPRRGRSAGQPL
jgi:uncharacterized protein YjbI with pentapeptide repeats